MATWQFDLRAIPRHDLEQHLGATPTHIRFEELDDVITTFQFDVAAISRRLNDLLRPEETWSPDVHRFGEEEGTRVDVTMDDRRIESILMRLDAQSLNSVVVIRLAELGRELDLLFVSENGEVVPPSPRRLFSALAASNAARFVADPEAFLASLPPDNESRPT
jgi:hypothetical protein